MANQRTRSYFSPSLLPAGEPEFLLGYIPNALLSNREAFIACVRSGIPGQWLAGIINAIDCRDAIAEALNMAPEQLDAACEQDAMDSRSSEVVLDIARLLSVSVSVFESQEISKRWLNSSVPALADQTPASLMDTFEGRLWVTEILRKIQGGQFS